MRRTNCGGRTLEGAKASLFAETLWDFVSELEVDKGGLTGVDGYMAVQLWYDYVNNNNEQALRTLLDYNEEDVVNLRVLRRKLGIK